MGKLEKLPYKVLFYLGFFIVIIFIGLSYWQLSSHYDDKNNLENISKYETLLKVSISDINNLSDTTNKTIPVGILGDFNSDYKIDENDIELFEKEWENNSTNADLGPEDGNFPLIKSKKDKR